MTLHSLNEQEEGNRKLAASQACDKHVDRVKRYFYRNRHTAWSFPSFEQQSDSTNSDGQIPDSYVKSLRAITYDCEKDCFSQLEKAQASKLLASYHTISRALKRHRDNAAIAPGQVINVNGGNHGSIGHGSTVNINGTPQQSSKRKHESEGNEYVEQQDDTGHEANFLTRFKSEYAAMRPTDKFWLSCTGRAVEDVIYQWMQKESSKRSDNELSDHLFASWIVDLGSYTINDIFTPEELQEVHDNTVDSLPAVPTHLEAAIDFFQSETARTLRSRLAEFDKTQESLDDDHWSFIHQAFLNWFLERKNLKEKHLEAWWSCNLWANLLDRTMQMLEAVVVERGESVCRATLDRKYPRRDNFTPTSLKGVYKLDGVIRFEDIELATIEAAPSSLTVSDNAKYRSDRRKMTRTLHDMIRKLHATCGHDTIYQNRVQVYGILQHGLLCHAFGLQQKGSICYLRTLFETKVPTTEKCERFCHVLKWILRLREGISHTVEVIEGSSWDDSNRDSSNVHPLKPSPKKGGKVGNSTRESVGK